VVKHSRVEGAAADSPTIQFATRVLDAVRPRTFAIGAAALIATLATFGILQRTLFPTWSLANLDSETSAATFFSATLLWAAAAGWVLVAIVTSDRRKATWTWAVILIFLAIDEGNAIHEKLERWSGIDWQVLYIPLLFAAGLTAWNLVRGRHLDTATRAFVATAAAWAITLLLELIQNWGGEPIADAVYDPTMVAEETLEMVGATLMAIAALTWTSRKVEDEADAAINRLR
jgi:hypothetical protein